MKPAPFEYSLPTTLDEAIGALADGDAKVLAGGQSLIPLMSMRLASFERLVDLRAVPALQGCGRVNGSLRIGAMTRQADAEHDSTVRGDVPLLAVALPNIGHFQIRNQGTIGGSIAHADPAAELPAVALALDATLEAVGPGGTRRIPASEFFLATFDTALDDAEILTAVEFPVWGAGSGFAVEEMARRSGDFALVGAMCGVHVSSGRIDRATIAMFGVGSTPIRCSTAEQGLIGESVDGLAAADVAREAAAGLDPPSDVHASAAYRRHVGATMVERALVKALEEAGNA